MKALFASGRGNRFEGIKLNCRNRIQAAMGSQFKLDIFILSLILTITSVPRVQSQQYMEIRLMYGMNSAEGAVVMYKDNRWWPICGESWTHTEAKIACKQLGFPYPYAESHSLPAYIDMNVSQGMNWLDGFRCGGHESQLKWCRYAGWGYCTSRLAAGVTCHRTTVSESSIFESNFLWPLAMVIFGGFMVFVCYKKAREQHNMSRAMQTTTLHLEESDDDNPPETGNQVYPDSVIHNAAFNGGNFKTTYTTRPLSQDLQGHLSMAGVQGESSNLTELHGNLPGNQEWVVSAPPSATLPEGFASSHAYQMVDSSPQQGLPPYPSEDSHSHDIPPPPPSYEEATQSNR